MNAWLVVAVVGAGSYAFRISMLVLSARRGLPRLVELAAGYAVPVSFAALAASSLTDRVADVAVPLTPIVAVAAAAVAVRRTGSPRAALIVGMPIVWLLAAVTGG